MKIKTYNFLLLTLLLAWCQSLMGQKPVISSVTVQSSGAVKINWFPIASASAYEIYRDSIKINEKGFNPFDTVFGSNSFEYIDIEVDARLQSIGYKIKYIPGEELSDPHFTIYLNKIIYDSCSRTNTLYWNSYATWQNAVYYNIYDSDGNDIVLNWPDTTFTHNIEPGSIYSYIIKAVNSISPSFTSSSNIDSVYTTPIKSPNSANFYINNITYDGVTANFTAVIDTSADLLGHTLMVSADNIIFTEVAFDTINKDIPSIEFSHDTTNQPLFYKVNAIGVCNDTVASTQVVKPMVLNISESNETEVTLNWNVSFNIDESYTANVIKDGGSEEKITPITSPHTIEYTDIDPDNLTESFKISIIAEDINTYKSFSNTILVSRQPKYKIPNAFNPSSQIEENRDFGPFINNDPEKSYIQNVKIESFKLIIYDKFGGAVFVTDDEYKVWVGDYKYKYVPEGGYIYYLWFKTAQGKTYEKSGVINVVYP